MSDTVGGRPGGGGGGIWEEDGNSPLEVNDATSGTVTLAGEYDVVKLIVVTTGFGSSGNARKVPLRVNGDTTANYDVTALDGTRTSKDADEVAFRLGPGVGTVIQISGRWDEHLGFGHVRSGSEVSEIDGGQHVGITSPLTSITAFETDGSAMNLKARVYGLSE